MIIKLIVFWKVLLIVDSHSHGDSVSDIDLTGYFDRPF